MNALTNETDITAGGKRGNCGKLRDTERVLAQREWLLTVLVTRLRGNHDVAEDLFGDLLAEVAAGQHDLSQVEALEPWLYRLIVNRANDWMRGQRRFDNARERLAAIRVTNEMRRQFDLPLDILLRDERAGLLRKALSSLEFDVTDAEILNLKYIHAWSYAQLQKHLGLNQNQIAHRLRSARQRLKQVLLQIQDLSHWHT
ncbi:MAG TPA: sigma-70 family RNA polymerase sigma factor [Pirellulaceae bacterium]|nr:sigma-70 family RNA polymerase sigma factor [Pirellulaceae bacterium]HMO93807.1 sigma-70 family RNA polymerase sigma factor [Pirellulaceae bacterium]HMP70599.1 sigma-70 family RNA polymerase sigma factor [Pirellulaceae bacterium]